MQHHWWHLSLRQAVWVRNCLERSTTPPGTTPYQLLIGKKPDLTLVRVWGCMVQFMVPEQQRGGKLVPKARWGLHLGVSPESKGWEVLDVTDNKVVTLGADAGTPADGHLDGNGSLAHRTPPFPVADRPVSTPVLATGDEGSLEASSVALASGIAGGRQGAKLVDQNGKPSTTGEQQTGEPVKQEAAVGVQLTGEPSKSAGLKQLVDNLAIDQEGELSAGEESTDSDVVEPERLSFHACLPPAAFTAVYDEVDDDLLYDDAEEDEELPELDPDIHDNPEHRWDIATMTAKEALVSWKGEVVKAAMEEEIRSLINMGTWELVESLCGVNIMKNRWVCGADYNETYSPVSSYVTLRIFLSIVTVLDLNLMQLDMKNAFLQSKLDRVLYMYQPDYFDDGTSRVCKLLKSLYGLKQSLLLWYRALDGVLLGAGWKKSQVDEALYFKAGDIGVTCWVLVYIDDLLTASSSPAMLKELKELLEAAFELREISPVVKYLVLEIVRDRPARKLWLH
ncbi:unnamed protein product [Closterium sp. NIES-54]